MPFTYEYPRPAVAVDCVVFGLDEGQLKVLLIERNMEPFANEWALPGGFVQMNETLDEAARRKLLEETGIENLFLEQLYTFGEVERDPRERIVSVAYYALVKMSDHRLRTTTNARQAAWFAVKKRPTLAFDHAQIVEMALARLQGKLRYQPIGFELLPPKFTLSQLQALYETVLERPLDKRNFRKKILGLGLLTELDETQSLVAHRAARLYRFDKNKYRLLEKKGGAFEI